MPSFATKVASAALAAVALLPAQPAPVVKYGRELVPFAEVRKNGTYFRRMFADQARCAPFVETGRIPRGCLIVMETWLAPGQPATVFARERTRSGWRNGSFPPDSTSVRLSGGFGCNLCHRRTEGFFRAGLLRRALRTSEVAVVECPKGPLGACSDLVYGGESTAASTVQGEKQ